MKLRLKGKQCKGNLLLYVVMVWCSSDSDAESKKHKCIIGEISEYILRVLCRVSPYLYLRRVRSWSRRCLSSPPLHDLKNRQIISFVQWNHSTVQNHISIFSTVHNILFDHNAKHDVISKYREAIVYNATVTWTINYDLEPDTMCLKCSPLVYDCDKKREAS